MRENARRLPVRMCVICRKRAPKHMLTRFIADKDTQEPVQDIKGTLPGRGMYVCNDERCRETFSRTGGKKKRKGQKV